MAQNGIVLTEAQVAALEQHRHEKEAHGEFESEHPGYCGAQDTFYVGTLKGVGRIYRKHAIPVLNANANESAVDVRPTKPRLRLYDEAVRQAVIVLWETSDRICGRRLRPLLPILVSAA